MAQLSSVVVACFAGFFLLVVWLVCLFSSLFLLLVVVLLCITDRKQTVRSSWQERFLFFPLFLFCLVQAEKIIAEMKRNAYLDPELALKAKTEGNEAFQKG